MLPGAAVGSAGVGAVLRLRVARLRVLAAVDVGLPGGFVAEGVAGSEGEPGVAGDVAPEGKVEPGMVGGPGGMEPGLVAAPGREAAGPGGVPPGAVWAMAEPAVMAAMATGIRRYLRMRGPPLAATQLGLRLCSSGPSVNELNEYLLHL